MALSQQIQIEITPSVARLQILAQSGYTPRGILDIGANRGYWATLARHLFRDSFIYMIEAQNEMAISLDAVAHGIGNAEFSIALLGDAPRKAVPFHKVMDLGQTGSSIFPENSSEPQQVEMCDMTTVDELLAAQSTQKFDFIKLDVQGAELKVLAGAQKALAQAEYVLMEAAVLPYNAGAPLIHEVLPYMAAQGFVTDDIMDMTRIGDQGNLLQVDILFIRENSSRRLKPPYDSK